MAAQNGDISVVGGSSVSPIYEFPVDDRTTSTQTETIKPGNPVQLDNENYVEIIADGGPVYTTGLLVGIAQDQSTETSSAEGVVNVQVAVPFVTILRGKATTTANADSASDLLAIRNDSVCFDNTSNVITIDENEGKQKIKLFIERVIALVKSSLNNWESLSFVV